MKERKKPVYSVPFHLIKREKGKSIPEDGEVLSHRGRGPKFPIQDLAVDESFSFPLNASQEAAQWKATRSAIYAHNKLNPEKNFVIRIIRGEQVLRVWRIKDTPAPKPAPAARPQIRR
jgi:hypothetical protein